jgi:hypothetical protein
MGGNKPGEMVAVHYDGAGGSAGGIEFTNVLLSGDQPNSVWKAESGGKTQTPSKYTVQTNSPGWASVSPA